MDVLGETSGLIGEVRAAAGQPPLGRPSPAAASAAA
jgi:hypothetical protein